MMMWQTVYYISTYYAFMLHLLPFPSQLAITSNYAVYRIDTDKMGDRWEDGII